MSSASRADCNIRLLAGFILQMARMIGRTPASPEVRSDFGRALRELLAAAGSDACERVSVSGKP